MLNSGNYDQAINKSIKKLKRNPGKEKEILVLQKAYKKANDRDKEKIQFLKADGTPDNWDNIFSLYTQMSYRQEKIKPLLPLEIASTHQPAVFEILNYDQEIINAKQKAAEYFYVHANSLLDKNDKIEARKAYNEFQQVKSYYPNYKNVDELLKKAWTLGCSYVLFKMENRTGVPLPPNFEEELTKISLSDLNANWLLYETKENKQHHYDYTILVNMKQIDVSPESVKEINNTEFKEVQDGYEYLLDDKGNVKKDSLGNDIKKPKYKTIKCMISETYQSKKAIIGGTLDYMNNNTGQLIKTNPIASENFFEYSSATAIGDLNALKPESRNKLGKKPVPFPNNFDMIFKAGQSLKGMVKDIIWSNKGILQ
jgi:tetratricopeptide (TPR) repeat protein